MGDGLTADPAAFMCYAHFDDNHGSGRLTKLRGLLAAEVQAQTGREFQIFQDRHSITWGQNWQHRIDEALDAVSFLLVIVTPGLLQSSHCRGEIARFRKREQELGRLDLILPLYYVKTREMEDPAARAGDEIAELLATRQFFDWTALRFEPLDAGAVLRALEHLASEVKDRLWQTPDTSLQVVDVRTDDAWTVGVASHQPPTAATAAARADDGDRLLAKNLLSDAEHAYRTALELDPRLARAYMGLGATLSVLRRYQEAEVACREAIRLDPNLAKAHNNLGLALNLVGRLAEAEVACREAIRLDPNFALAHNTLGFALLKSGRLAEAEVACREAIRLDPNLVLAHNNLGLALRLAGRPAEAEGAYRTAIRLDPNLALAHFNLGDMLGEAGRLIEAESAYREGIRLDPNDVMVHNNLGNVLRTAGRMVEAEGAYRQAIRLDPSDATARINLNSLLKAQKRRKRWWLA